MTFVKRSADLTDWLRHLDSYTNAEFGQARTLAAVRDQCVACGETTQAPDIGGLCKQCATRRRPDHTEVILFRPLRRREPARTE
jgi:hypothetical protein